MKYLHTMVRVTDVDASLDFYCNKLGLEELRGLLHGAGEHLVLVHLVQEASKELDSLR